MSKRKLLIIIFILSLFSLLISLKLSWNFGIFVEKYNFPSLDILFGGFFWHVMDWLKLLLLLLLCIASGISIFKDEKNK